MLKVGLIVDDGSQPYLVTDLIAHSLSSKHYRIDCLVVQRQVRERSASPWARAWTSIRLRGWISFFSKHLMAIIRYLEVLRFARLAQCRPMLTKTPLDQCAPEKIFVSPEVSSSGLVHRFSAADLEKMRERQLDVLIRCGSGILRGDILTLCRFGILSFHHGDNRINRGRPPAFWEVYQREASTGFILQRLLPELDGGDVLLRGRIPTAPFFLLNQLKLFRKSNVFLHRLLDELGRTHRYRPTEVKTPYAYPLYKLPNLWQQGRYLAHVVAFLVSKLADRLLKRNWRWGVAYQFVDDWRTAVLWRAKVIRNPPYRYLADPFVVEREGRTVCFVEDFDFRSRLGKITAYELGRGQAHELGEALAEPFHLSYPYVFEAEGDLYMCPETHKQGEIRLYKCDDFPLRWSLHKILMRQIKAVDTTIFFHQGRWWMLTNLDSSDQDEFCSELHVFYADRFDSECWQPHPSNPIFIDCERARNGGFFVDQGQLFRVFQMQGFRIYGASMGIAKIETLSLTEYREREICRLPPKFFGGIEGTHSFSFNGSVVAIDFVRKERYRH